jgi:3-deoxy-7-phosphoheptulonate synthase
MSANIDDLRIRNLRELLTPEALIGEMPASNDLAQHVTNARSAIQAVLNQSDDRLVVVVGPCSIHDPVAAMDYARA